MRVLQVLLLMLSLSYTSLRANSVMQFCQQLVALGAYSDKIIKITSEFDGKYGNHPRLQCVACEKEKLTHGEFLGRLFAYTLGNDSAKKLMDEALEIFPQKPLVELVDFMLKAANEISLACLKCGEKQWIKADNNVH